MIFRLATTRGWARKKRHVKYAPRYAVEECLLYGKFLWRRALGRRATRKWASTTMRKLLLNKGVSLRPTNYGVDWAAQFYRRWEITNQCRTNKKCKPVSERLDPIVNFLKYLHYGVQRSEPQRCPKYGRFPSACIFHMDQIPFEFCGGKQKTYNPKGCKEGCRLGDPANSDDKRFCSVQLTLCGGGPGSQVVSIEVYFASDSDGDRISPDELAFYTTLANVKVRWQKSAWADESIIVDYVVDFRKQTAHLPEVLLGMDRHGSQKTPLVSDLMNYLKIFPVYTPPECTDCCSPCDHHVGANLKSRVHAFYDAAYEVNQDFWNSGGLTLPMKRMLVSTWISAAWRDICVSLHKARI